MVMIVELMNSHSDDADPLPCPDPCNAVLSVSVYDSSDIPRAVLMWNCIALIALACSRLVLRGTPKCPLIMVANDIIILS